MSDPRPPVAPAAPAGAPRPVGGPIHPPPQNVHPTSHPTPVPRAPQPQQHPHAAPGMHSQSPQQPRPAVQHPPGMMPAAAPRTVVRPPGSPAPMGTLPQARIAPSAPSNGGPAKMAVMPTLEPADLDDEAITLVEEGDDVQQEAVHKKIKAFGPEATTRSHQWKRQPVKNGTGAVRVKSFHAKLSDQGLEFIDEAINTFIDDHPEVDIKFVTTNVGLVDGKIKDVGIIVQVWY